MITFKKVKVCFLLIFVFVNIFYIAPCYSLSLREDLFKNAIDLSSGGQFNLALQEWNHYLDSYPDDAAALSNRGNVRLVIGDVEGSIDDQNKAIGLNPNEIDPYINRGIAEEALGLWSQAKKDYMFVISQDNKNFSALYNLANVEGSASQWEKARDLFSKAATYNPGFAMARSSMALADFQLGNIDESEKELKKLIRRYPTFADARAALTALNWYNGEYGKAESNWIAVTELDPRYSDEKWLKTIRRWPPKPIKDLMNFIDLK
ncbi:TPR repeat [Prochlorococcus marinus str. MIT 9312]|uniref:TPR repeat n=1 Tax=Prochlorococcus marinus (strain MIT 9312) TaxID=74546 RepID=Q318C7_PROM9|nr:tetratricopeptide repeat protein [Prochlorococcus marinus]ABB50768.1 TPR repeat [Prochlorococcus marinus str. MIT 9312]